MLGRRRAHRAAIINAIPARMSGLRTVCPVKGRLARDHDTVRIADDDVGAHLDQRIDEVHAALEELLEEEHRAPALGGEHQHGAHEVRRELGPGAVVHPRHPAAHVGLDAGLLPARQVDRGMASKCISRPKRSKTR